MDLNENELETLAQEATLKQLLEVTVAYAKANINEGPGSDQSDSIKKAKNELIRLTEEFQKSGKFNRETREKEKNQTKQLHSLSAATIELERVKNELQKEANKQIAKTSSVEQKAKIQEIVDLEKEALTREDVIRSLKEQARLGSSEAKIKLIEFEKHNSLSKAIGSSAEKLVKEQFNRDKLNVSLDEQSKKWTEIAKSGDIRASLELNRIDKERALNVQADKELQKSIEEYYSRKAQIIELDASSKSLQILAKSGDKTAKFHLMEIDKKREIINTTGEENKKLVEEIHNRAIMNAKLADSKKVLDGFYKGIESTVTSLVSTVSTFASMGNSLSSAASSLKVIPVVGSVLASTFGAVAGAADKIYKSFQQAASIGANFSGSMTDMINSATGAGLTFEQFSGIIAKNGASLAALGGTTDEGAKRLGALGKSLRTSGLQDSLVSLGYNTSDINDGLAQYSGVLARTGILSKMNNDQIVASAASYMQNIDAISKLTGMSKSEIRSKQDALKTDAQFRGAERDIAQKFGADAAKNFTGFITTLGDGEEGIRESLSSGFASSKKAQLATIALSETYAEAQNLYAKRMRGEEVTQEDYIKLDKTKRKELLALANDKERIQAYTQVEGPLRDVALTALRVASETGNLGSTIEKAKKSEEERIKREKELKDKGLSPKDMEIYQQKIADTSNEFTKLLASSGMLEAMMKTFGVLTSLVETFVAPAFKLIGDHATALGVILIPVAAAIGALKVATILLAVAETAIRFKKLAEARMSPVAVAGPVSSGPKQRHATGAVDANGKKIGGRFKTPEPATVKGGSGKAGLATAALGLFGDTLLSFIPSIIGWVASLGSFSGIVASVGAFFSTVLLPALAALAIPIAIVAGTLILIAGAGYLVYKLFEDWKDKGNTVSLALEALSDGFITAGMWIKKGSITLLSWISNLIPEFLGGGKDLKESVERMKQENIATEKELKVRAEGRENLKKANADEIETKKNAAALAAKAEKDAAQKIIDDKKAIADAESKQQKDAIADKKAADALIRKAEKDENGKLLGNAEALARAKSEREKREAENAKKAAESKAKIAAEEAKIAEKANDAKLETDTIAARIADAANKNESGEITIEARDNIIAEERNKTKDRQSAREKERIETESRLAKEKEEAEKKEIKAKKVSDTVKKAMIEGGVKPAESVEQPLTKEKQERLDTINEDKKKRGVEVLPAGTDIDKNGKVIKLGKVEPAQAAPAQAAPAQAAPAQAAPAQAAPAQAAPAAPVPTKRDQALLKQVNEDRKASGKVELPEGTRFDQNKTPIAAQAAPAAPNTPVNIKPDFVHVKPDPVNIKPDIKPHLDKQIPSIVTSDKKKQPDLGQKKGSFTGFGENNDKNIAIASKKYGMDEKAMRGFVKMEGGWKGDVSSTGAIGAGQFIVKTWNDLAKTEPGQEIGMTPVTEENKGTDSDPRFNNQVNIMATALLAKDNARILKAAGLKADTGNLYMMHNIGPGVIPALKGSDNVSPRVINGMMKNGMKSDQTPTEFVRMQKEKFNKHYEIANAAGVNTTVPTTQVAKADVDTPTVTQDGKPTINPSAAEGAVFSGPKSGFKTTLHGDEAVIPLSGGRTVPVKILSAPATPVAATPVAATPVAATPVAATPVAATPVAATPVTSIAPIAATNSDYATSFTSISKSISDSQTSNSALYTTLIQKLDKLIEVTPRSTKTVGAETSTIASNPILNTDVSQQLEMMKKYLESMERLVSISDNQTTYLKRLVDNTD